METRMDKLRRGLRSLALPALVLAALVGILGVSCSSPVSNAGTDRTAAASRATAGSVDFREESIYFLIPSRFIDGDSSNNVPTEWCSYNGGKNEITDPADVTWRGDFRGLIDTGLDYIHDLGFTAVWLTPVVQNRGPLDYHGYHAWDLTKVDPRLETPGYTYQDFINKAHSLGIKVIQDVVWNHSGRYGFKDVAELKYNTDPTQDWGKDKNGNTLKDNPNWEYDGKTPNPDDGKIWSRANLAKMPAPYNANLALHNWPSTESFVYTSDAAWWHHAGNGFVQGWDDTDNLYNKAIAGDCPDLNTESQQVRDYLVNAYKKYIDMGVDAFRVDTVKHMDRSTVQYFVDQFKAYDPNLFIFGEVAQKRHELHSVEEINPHWYTWRGAVGNSPNSGMAILDFYAEATFHGVFEEGGGMGGLTDCARYDSLYSDPSTNVTWLDNHDFGPNNDWNRRYSGSAEGMASYVNFAWTWRGIPSLYYGSEIQFMKGAYTDIMSSSDINRSLDSTGRAYYGNQIAGAKNNKLYQHIKKMNAIRRAIPALQKGSWAWAGNPSSGDGLGFIRAWNGTTVAVGLAKGSTVSFNFTGLPAGTYRDAVTGSEIVSGGSLSFSVSAGSAGVYVLNGPGLVGALGAGFFQATSNGGGGGGDTGWTAAYFRGTPNGWGTTAMTKNATTGLWETTATFGSDSPRFKISRFTDWTEAYPSTDYTISAAGTYNITFNETTKAITATVQSLSVPAAPTGLAAGTPTNTAIPLSWTASSGATSYGVYFATSTSGPYSLVGTATGTSYTVSGLAKGTTYFFKVCASNAAGTSAYSSVASAKTASGLVSNYRTMYLRGSMNSWGATAMSLAADNTWTASVTLAAGTTYTYKYEISGSSSWSTNWGAGSAGGTAAQNGGNISFTATTAGSYVFTFNDSTLKYAVAGGGTPACATPTFSIASGSTIPTTASVKISTATSGATIYYTTDGSAPTTASRSGAAGSSSATVALSGTAGAKVTVKAIAVCSGYTTSAAASATWTYATSGVVAGRLTVVFVNNSSAQSITLPGDFNSWSLSANTLSAAAGATKTVVIDGAITAASLARGDSASALELQLCNQSSLWNGAWNFTNWTKGSGLTVPNGKQITIPCTASNEVTLTVNVATTTLSVVVK